MTNLIVLKTDASFKPGVGSGISFETKVIEEGVHQQSFQDNMTVEYVRNSTDAELTAIVFGLKNVFENVQNPGKYEISVNSDCQHTVNVFNDEYYKQNQFRKVSSYFLNRFSEWRVTWISRESNEKADGLAKSALDTLEESLD